MWLLKVPYIVNKLKINSKPTRINRQAHRAAQNPWGPQSSFSGTKQTPKCRERFISCGSCPLYKRWVFYLPKHAVISVHTCYMIVKNKLTRCSCCVSDVMYSLLNRILMEPELQNDVAHLQTTRDRKARNRSPLLISSTIWQCLILAN